MVNHRPATFDDHKHCGSGDIIYLVADEEDARCSSYNPSSLFISKGHDLKAQSIILTTLVLVTHALNSNWTKV